MAELVGDGWTNDEIAGSLSLEPDTVKKYVSRVFALTHVGQPRRVRHTRLDRARYEYRFHVSGHRTPKIGAVRPILWNLYSYSGGCAGLRRRWTCTPGRPPSTAARVRVRYRCP
ncbi:hypothetical protein [Gordonia oryzae]|uniref:hypothetical protein n=1 Tax=Gordonia oryzae TaxID=2487349 RepID=UPI003CCC85B4